MTATETDLARLQEYVRSGSEDAFRAVVEGRMNFVYSIALAQVGSKTAEEDVAQIVFSALARKAGCLSQNVVLSGWLFQATTFACRNFKRAEARRTLREREAVQNQNTDSNPSDNVDVSNIAPVISSALASLATSERDAILLRFFEGQEFREVAGRLGISDAAARMRVSRGLERLRLLLARRGITVSSAALSGALPQLVHLAPAGVGAAVKASLAAPSTLSPSNTALLKGVLKAMAWTKAKITIVAGVGLLLAVGTTTTTVKVLRLHRIERDAAIWETSNPATTDVEKVPPQVTLIPTKFPNEREGTVALISGAGNVRRIGIAETLLQILRTADNDNHLAIPLDDPAFYIRTPGGGSRPRAHGLEVIVPPDMPTNRFDFIANLPVDSPRALAELIKDKFGWIARRVTNSVDGFVITVDHTNAPGLKAANGDRSSEEQPHSGKIILARSTMAQFANQMEGILKVPVADKTGLAGEYDIEMTSPRPPGSIPEATRLENVKDTMLQQLGLKFAPASNLPQEVLKIEKIK